MRCRLQSSGDCLAGSFSEAFTSQGDAVCVVDEAVEDGIGDGGVADEVTRNETLPHSPHFRRAGGFLQIRRAWRALSRISRRRARRRRLVFFCH